jgi:hypothetical protein
VPKGTYLFVSHGNIFPNYRKKTKKIISINIYNNVEEMHAPAAFCLLALLANPPRSEAIKILIFSADRQTRPSTGNKNSDFC